MELGCKKGEIMNKILSWLSGKKTYITAIVYAIASVLDETGTCQIPAVVFQLLAAIGLITLRQGITSGK